MKKVTRLQIVEALVRLSVHYPESGHTNESLEVVAGDYFGAFSSWTPEVFKKAVKVALSRCRFFPKIADISDAMESAVMNIKALEYHNSPNQIAERPSYKSELDITEHKRKLGILIDMALRKKTEEDALKEF